MKEDRLHWLGGMRPLIFASITLAATALASCLALSDSAPAPDQSRFWMRSEAYQTAVTLAVARADIDRNNPSLIARDFTRRTAHVEDDNSVDTYTPCPLIGSKLIGSSMVNCSLSPGIGGVRNDDPRCPWQTCVVVSVRSETWADPVVRQVILSTLSDFKEICAYAQAYGPNKRFDWMAAGCGRPDREKVRLAIEVKPRLHQPCVYRELKAHDDHRFFQPICTNADATLVMAG